MDVNQHFQFLLPDASYLNSVKRDITRLAQNAGFSELEIGKINIVVSEMASNLVRHVPPGGEMLVRLINDKNQNGIEIISLDVGPGMAEPNRMQEDGVSTFGSAGEGLGAIKRQSDFFDLYSQVDTGTIVLSRIYKTVGKEPENLKNEKLETGAILVSKRIGDNSGDGWHLKQNEKATYLLALDGLGHGEGAHTASQEGIAAFEKTQAESTNSMLLDVHKGLKSTRGAVGALACISTENKDFRYCGIGNITGKIFGFDNAGDLKVTKNLMSYNGTLGHIIPTSFQEQTAEWQPGNILVMHSDGLKTPVELNRYPRIHQHDASVIAAVLFRDYNRHTDDALVVIAKAKN